MINHWKRAVLKEAQHIFERVSKKKTEVDEETVRSMHAKIGELVAANDFCRESSSLGPASEARDDRTSSSTLPVAAQCRLLSISRSSFYYAPLSGQGRRRPLDHLL